MLVEKTPSILVISGVEEQTAPLPTPCSPRVLRDSHGPGESTTWRHGGLKIHECSAYKQTDSAHINFLRSKADVMWKSTVLLAAALAVPAQALHFFIDGAVQKCFFEELPKDTLVVGMTAL